MNGTKSELTSAGVWGWTGVGLVGVAWHGPFLTDLVCVSACNNEWPETGPCRGSF